MSCFSQEKEVALLEVSKGWGTASLKVFTCIRVRVWVNFCHWEQKRGNHSYSWYDKKKPFCFAVFSCKTKDNMWSSKTFLTQSLFYFFLQISRFGLGSFWVSGFFSCGGFLCVSVFFFCGEHESFNLAFASKASSWKHMFSKLLMLFVSWNPCWKKSGIKLDISRSFNEEHVCISQHHWLLLRQHVKSSFLWIRLKHLHVKPNGRSSHGRTENIQIAGMSNQRPPFYSPRLMRDCWEFCDSTFHNQLLMKSKWGDTHPENRSSGRLVTAVVVCCHCN